MTMQHSLSSLGMKTLRKIRKEITWRHFHFHSIFPISSHLISFSPSLSLALLSRGYYNKIINILSHREANKIFSCLYGCCKNEMRRRVGCEYKKKYAGRVSIWVYQNTCNWKKFWVIFLWMIINFFPVSLHSIYLSKGLFSVKAMMLLLMMLEVTFIL